MELSISKNTFCSTIQAVITFIAQQGAIEYAVSEAIEAPFDCVLSRYRDELVHPIVEFITEAVCDEECLVGDFVYEPPARNEEFDLDITLRCGKSAVIHYKDWGDLYDYFALRAAQKGDSEESRQERERLCKAHGILCC